MKFTIETNNPALLKQLKSESPSGVTFIPNLAGMHTRCDPFSTLGEIFNISVNIDLGNDILKSVIAYILYRQYGTKGKHYLHIDGKRLPLDSPDLVHSEIDRLIEQHNQDNK